MNAIELLKKQHRELRQLFSEVEKNNLSPKDKEETVKSLAAKLNLHMAIEEEVFYPVVEEEVDAEKAKHATAEHDAIKPLIAAILQLQGQDETYDAKVAVIKELVEHHMEEEEETLFPRCRRELGTAALDDLGEELQDYLEEIKRGSEKSARRARMQTTSFHP